LQLTVGTIKEFNAACTRVRYDANSKAGSSGSPCFDGDLRLVALHHAHDPANTTTMEPGNPVFFDSENLEREQHFTFLERKIP